MTTCCRSLHIPSLVSLALLLSSGATRAQSAPTITIADFPRYGTALSGAQREDLRRVATGIAGALLTGADVDVSVVGHADFDVKGRAFENDVSRERALGGEAALKELVEEEIAKVALPASRLASVRYTSLGLGTARPIFSPPRNPDERRSNRRVDFTVTATAPQPTPSLSPFQRCVSVMAGPGPAGPARRMTCACNKLLQQSPRVQDTHYDFRARQRLPGLATLTPLQLDTAIRSMVLHMRQNITSSANGVSDADFANNLRALDDTVGRNINDFASQENAGAATSIFDFLVNADIRGRMADPNHVYSCYAGYSRANHDR